MDPISSQTKLKVYYDGLCIVCSREMTHYKGQQGAEQIEFVDITSDHFNAAKEGLDPKAVHKYMHVRLKDQTVKVGVDGFIEIWSVLPKYKFLVPIAKNAIVNFFMKTGYVIFARLRKYLPKNKKGCEDSPYC